MLLARIDEYGKAAWLGLVVLAFWAAWPLGLAVFAFLMMSGRARLAGRIAACAGSLVQPAQRSRRIG